MRPDDSCFRIMREQEDKRFLVAMRVQEQILFDREVDDLLRDFGCSRLAVDVKLPDPSSTGAKAPAPPAAPVAAVPGAAAPLHIPTAAADIIKQYMTRR